MNFIKKIKNTSLPKNIFWGVIGIVLMSPVYFCRAVQTTGGTTGGNTSSAKLENPLAVDTPMALVASLTTTVAKIGVPVATVFIIYSGLLFVTARGNEEKLKNAKTTFFWSVLGTGILLGAWVIGSAIGSTICSVGGGVWTNGKCI